MINSWRQGLTRSDSLRHAVSTAVATVLVTFLALGAAPTDSASADVERPGVLTSGSVAEPTVNTAPDAVLVAAPKIVGPPDRSFIGSSRPDVEGTRAVDQEIQLLSPTGQDPLCIVAPNGTTSWRCDGVPVPNGASVVLRIVVTGQPELSDQITIAVLGAPTVLGGPTGQSASNGVVRGTGEPGATVTPLLASGQTCAATADSAGSWACLVEGPLKSGSTSVTASQTKTSISGPSSSHDSASVTIRFDLDPPAAPALTSPRGGAQVSTAGASYAGTGESGATATVFAGAYSVCSAVVAGTTWRCAGGGVAAGTYNVIAVQQDEAGNVSGGSSAISVEYAAPTGTTSSAVPLATATPRTPGATRAPTPKAPQTDAPDPADSAVPAPPTAGPPSPSAPALGDGGGPGDSEGSPSAWPGGSWEAPTRFTAAVASPFPGVAYPWLQAVLFAGGAVLLLAIPSRLLAGTIARARNGRPRWRATPWAGRNRVREEFETAPTVHLNRWLLGAAALVAAATLVMLSGPIVSQPAYLRLLVAVVIALFLVNLVASVAPLSWSSRVLKVDATITFLPRYLLLVFLTAIGSRVFGVEPALLFGLLGSANVVAGTAAHRGQLATVRAASLIGLAVFGWFVLGVLPTATSFSTSLIAEIVNTVVLASIGSAVFILVPLGSTSGRSILVWSPALWVGLTVGALTVLFGVLHPVIAIWQSEGTIALVWVAAAAFAALSCGAWAWQRFVAPSRP